jgi:DNA-directed RNA polymerase specialized sigma24 family protein
MHAHSRHPRRTTPDRIERIAAMHAQHARRLERQVACRVYATPQTIEDACSFAWMQLVRHTSVDLGLPDAPALGWLSLTATREARSLEAKRAREQLVDDIDLERARWRREQVAPGTEDLAAQRARLRLVTQIPERPRRFMLRHALGYTYREVAADENVSMTTTDKQIARGKRLLRALDAADPSEHGRSGRTPAGSSQARLSSGSPA